MNINLLLNIGKLAKTVRNPSLLLSIVTVASVISQISTMHPVKKLNQ